ncbi:hypothetical protein BD413DRAFT_296207 [Trametes elegans]|nr:hypothetical protein BD413DRAFT_296207 [Trametes elegans]
MIQCYNTCYATGGILWYTMLQGVCYGTICYKGYTMVHYATIGGRVGTMSIIGVGRAVARRMRLPVRESSHPHEESVSEEEGCPDPASWLSPPEMVRSGSRKAKGWRAEGNWREVR